MLMYFLYNELSGLNIDVVGVGLNFGCDVVLHFQLTRWLKDWIWVSRVSCYNLNDYPGHISAEPLN